MVEGQQAELIRDWFDRAVDGTVQERKALLDEIGSSDPIVADQVRRLIEGHESADGFMQRPAAPFSFEDSGNSTVLRNGDVLSDRFLIEEFLGRGGIGEVYCALDLELGARIAIKTLRAELASDASVIDGLKSELQVARSLAHPNVCKMFDVDATVLEDGRRIWFITMELVVGETLSARLKRGPVRQPLADQIGRQLIDGLGAAHAQRIVHGDFKSSNVMVSEADGIIRVVITDFGLARRLPSDQETLESKLKTGSFFGTPAYMAPEQLRGAKANIASDIHALGAVLFEMRTGRLPFPGESQLESALARLQNEAPSPAEFDSSIEPGWTKATLACLERNAQERPKSTAAVLALLQETGQGWSWSRRSFMKSLRWPAIATAAGTAVVIVNRAMQPEPPLPAEAIAAMQLGNMFLRDRSQWSLRNAIEEFQKATKAAPAHAPAWAGLAEAYASLNNFGFERFEALRKATEAAKQAVALDPNDGRNRTVLAFVVALDVRRWAEAEPHFQRAFRLPVREKRIYCWYPAFLGRRREFAQAIRLVNEGVIKYPDDFPIMQQQVAELFRAGKFGEMHIAATELVRRFRDKPMARLALARAHEMKGRLDEARQECAEAERLEFKEQALCQRSTIESAAGHPIEARRYANQALALLRENKLEALQVASAFAALKDGATAVQLLEEGYDRGDSSVLGAPSYWYFRSLEGDRGFRAFARKIGL